MNVQSVEDAIDVATRKMKDAKCVVIMSVNEKGELTTTTYIDNAGAALAFIRGMKQVETGILFPQPSKVIRP